MRRGPRTGPKQSIRMHLGAWCMPCDQVSMWTWRDPGPAPRLLLCPVHALQIRISSPGTLPVSVDRILLGAYSAGSSASCMHPALLVAACSDATLRCACSWGALSSCAGIVDLQVAAACPEAAHGCASVARTHSAHGCARWAAHWDSAEALAECPRCPLGPLQSARAVP